MNFSCGATSEQQCPENQKDLEKFRHQTGSLPSAASVILPPKLRSDGRSKCCQVNQSFFCNSIPVFPVVSSAFFTLSGHKSLFFSCQVPKNTEPLWGLFWRNEAREVDRDRVQSDVFTLDGAWGQPRPKALTELPPPD